MTLNELRACDKPYLTAADISDLLEAAPESIRDAARENPKGLPFPVVVIGTRVKIPRVPFVEFAERVYGGK